MLLKLVTLFEYLGDFFQRINSNFPSASSCQNPAEHQLRTKVHIISYWWLCIYSYNLSTWKCTDWLREIEYLSIFGMKDGIVRAVVSALLVALFTSILQWLLTILTKQTMEANENFSSVSTALQHIKKEQRKFATNKVDRCRFNVVDPYVVTRSRH